MKPSSSQVFPSKKSSPFTRAHWPAVKSSPQWAVTPDPDTHAPVGLSSHASCARTRNRAIDDEEIRRRMVGLPSNTTRCTQFSAWPDQAPNPADNRPNTASSSRFCAVSAGSQARPHLHGAQHRERRPSSAGTVPLPALLELVETE